jgi:hypothetical protein
MFKFWGIKIFICFEKSKFLIPQNFYFCGHKMYKKLAPGANKNSAPSV